MMAGGGDMGLSSLGDLASGMGSGMGGNGSGGGSSPMDPMGGGSGGGGSGPGSEWSNLNTNQATMGDSMGGGSPFGGGGQGGFDPGAVSGTQNDPAVQSQSLAANLPQSNAGSGGAVSPGSGTQPTTSARPGQSMEDSASHQLQHIADALLGRQDQQGYGAPGAQTAWAGPGWGTNYGQGQTATDAPQPGMPQRGPQPQQRGPTPPAPAPRPAVPMPRPRPAEAGAGDAGPPTGQGSNLAWSGPPIDQSHGATGSWDDSPDAGGPPIPGRMGAGADQSLYGGGGSSLSDLAFQGPPQAPESPAAEAGYGPKPAGAAIPPSGNIGSPAGADVGAKPVPTTRETMGEQPIPGSSAPALTAPSGPTGTQAPEQAPPAPQQGDKPAPPPGDQSNAPPSGQAPAQAAEASPPAAPEGDQGQGPQGPAAPGQAAQRGQPLNPIQAIVDLLFKGPQAFMQDLQSMAQQANQGMGPPSTGPVSSRGTTPAAPAPVSPQSPSAPGKTNEPPQTEDARQAQQRQQDTGRRGGSFIIDDKGQRVQVETNPDGSMKTDAAGNPVPMPEGAAQGASGAPVTRGSYPDLGSRMASGRQMGPVHPGLQDTLAAGSQSFEQAHPGYKVQANSGYRGGGNDPHGRRNAVDMQIIGPQGPIANAGADTTKLYTDLARHVLGAQKALHPELNGQLAWGGYFNANGGHGFADPATGANRPDLMHFDLEGNRSYRTAMRDRFNALGPQGNFGAGKAAQGPQSSLTPPGADTQARPSRDIYTPGSSEPHTELAQARQQFKTQVTNPRTARLIAASTLAEVGGQGPMAEQAYIESVVNRAAARGQNLDHAFGPQSGYYPPETVNKLNRAIGPQDQQRINSTVQKVLAGSNVSKFATGNGSGTVTGFNKGYMTYKPSSRGGEHFGVEGPDRGWVQQMMRGTPAQAAPPSPPQRPLGPPPPPNMASMFGMDWV